MRISANSLIVVLAIAAAIGAGCKKSSGGPEAVSEASAEVAPTPPPAPTPTPAPTPEPTPEAAANRDASVVILCYHRFEEKPRDGMALSPADFELQLQRIKDEGFTVIPMADFLAWKRGEKAIPPKSCVITIDDGYRSVMEVGWPVLKKFGYPFTMFVYTDYVKGGPRAGGQSLSWDELAVMRDGGVDIQSHSVSHADLRSKKGRTAEAYQSFLQSELGESKRMIENELGVAVKTIAYPFGNNNEDVRKATLESGYEIGFTTYGQRVTFDSPNDAIGRYAIDSKDAKIFEAAMRMSGGGVSASYAKTVPAAAGGAVEPGQQAPGIRTSPADGETVTDTKPLITADLSSLGEVDPASIEMRLSGFGIVPAAFDAATKVASHRVNQKIREKTCTVFLTATAGGKPVRTRWTFKIDPAAAPGQ